MIWFALISTFILHVFAGVTSNLPPLKTVTSLATDFDKDLMHIKIPRSWSANLWGKIAKIPAKTINSYSAPSFFVNGYDVRVTEDFRKAHILGQPAQSFQKPNLLTNFENAFFLLPSGKWKYGDSKMLKSTAAVEMQERIRGDKLDSWKVPSKPEKIEGVLNVKATKYRGARASNGRYEKDILLIEDIAMIPKVPKHHPVYNLGYLYAEVPSMFFGDLQIIALENFIAKTLATIASPNVNFIKPDDFNSWLPYQDYLIYSKNYVKIQKYAKLTVERQIRVTAIKGTLRGTGQEIIMIRNLEVLPGPLLSPKYQGIWGIIKSEPSFHYGNRKTWEIPSFNLDGVHVRGTETFIRNHYYSVGGNDYKELTLNVVPSKLKIALSDESYHGLKEGESGMLSMSDYVINGEFRRNDIHSAWNYKGTTPYKLNFDALKYIDPVTKNPVVVLTGINSITVKPNMPKMNDPTPIVRV
jgi:hypothetical protein